MSVLKLRGGPALSSFRLDKLNERLTTAGLGLNVASSTFWHFAETARDLSAAEHDTLGRLLAYGPPAGPGHETSPGRDVLVAPRLGTISPWSSKATDIGCRVRTPRTWHRSDRRLLKMRALRPPTPRATPLRRPRRSRSGTGRFRRSETDPADRVPSRLPRTDR